MQTTSDTTSGQDSRKNTKRTERLSPDGLWLSFPKVPGLLQYVKSRVFYGRLKVRGKLIRRALHQAETPISFTDAKLKLGDFIKKERTRKVLPGTFAEARQTYETELASAHDIEESSKRYRSYCIKRLLKSWPELDQLPLEKITVAACKTWAAEFSQKVDETYFNNTLGTLRAILKIGGLTENPAMQVKRLGIKRTDLQLPEPAQFTQILVTIETAGARESKNCADLVRFLAFSGCRLSEARQVKWSDIDLQRGLITVHNAKVRRTKNGELLRYVPIIPDMLALLTRLQGSAPKPDEPVCQVHECEKSLTRACRIAKIPRITHHDLRHLFATRCIESGVDIPTVSRWLGHSDGGGLAMRVYGHLRTSHSTHMAKRVTFSAAAGSDIVELPEESAAA